MKRFYPSACMYRDAEDNPAKRLAIRSWLEAAISGAMGDGEAIAPGLALLSALEALDFGHVDPLFKLPQPREDGGLEDPPSLVGLKAVALASVDTLVAREMDVTKAIECVEKFLPEFAGKLANLRKKVNSERAKRPEDRQKYKSLIPTYENEMAFFNEWSKEKIVRGLKRLYTAHHPK